MTVSVSRRSPVTYGVAPNEYTSTSIATIGSQTITLILEVDPTNETVAGWYQLNGGTVQPIVSNQTPIDVPSSFFDGVDHDANAGTAAISFAGISATHGYAAADPIDFDFSGFSITPLGGGSAQRGALAQGAPAPGGRASLLARPDESVRLAEPLRQTNLITSTLTTTRTITYSYDGLSRLTGAVETGATTNSYAYTYDLAGNRTSATVNGTTTSHSYNAANQVVGWSYDAAGNLLSDGATTYTYDALGRTLTQGSTSYSYNGDGVLVAAGTIAYTHDLVAPLSQILSDGSTNDLYGHERLASSAGTWYLTDALGSVRQTLDASGAVTASASYDPWGTPQGSAIAPFGFTGEVQDDQGMVYLRARWYAARAGVFTSRDPFMGRAEQPYSLSYYQYGYSNPVLNTDPSGECVDGLTTIACVIIGTAIIGGLVATVAIATEANQATPAICVNCGNGAAHALEEYFSNTVPTAIERVQTDAPRGLAVIMNGCGDAIAKAMALINGSPLVSLAYTVKDHNLGTPAHARDEAEVRQWVRNTTEWWYKSAGGQDLYAGLSGPEFGPTMVVRYNGTADEVTTAYIDPVPRVVARIRIRLVSGYMTRVVAPIR